jgi:hypothetical protein
LFKKCQLLKAPHFTPRLFCVVIGHVCEKARALDWVDAIGFRQRPYSLVFNHVRRNRRAARTGRADQKRPAPTYRRRWGVIPICATDTQIAYKTINARAETAATAPALLPGCRTGDRVAFSGADGDRN